MFEHVGTQFLCTCPPNMELADLYSCVPKLYMTDPVKSEVLSFKKKREQCKSFSIFNFFSSLILSTESKLWNQKSSQSQTLKILRMEF